MNAADLDSTPSLNTLLLQAATLAEQSKPTEALAVLDQIIAISPQVASAWSNRGNMLHDLGRLDEALTSIDTALRINPHYALALCNQGVVLHDMQRWDDAVAAFDQALALDPNFALAHSNRGNAWRALHRYDLALADYVRATEIDPNFVNAHWNESTCRLHMGDYDLGWKKHEWRWQTAALQAQTQHTPRPTWLGESSPQGKKIVIWPEGGYGDAIQFTRFALTLQSRGAAVVLATPTPLLRLYQQSFKGIEILHMHDDMPMPKCDQHTSIMSLPLACGIDHLNKLAPATPYMVADLAESRKWQARLSAFDKTKGEQIYRVGITWAGNPKTGADLERSLHLSHFENFKKACQANTQFVSLQKGVASEQIQSLKASWEGPEVIDLTGQLHDWADTAALIANLDLIISCDTATAHLAAAMGKPVWLLSRYNGCWRWLADRTDSPWYPSVRLFRQTAFGDWETVMQDVAAALTAQSEQHENI